MRRACIYEMHSIKLGCLLCAAGLMLVGYSKIGYRYLFLPPACIRGPAFICRYRPRPRLLSEARPLIESRSLFADLRYTQTNMAWLLCTDKLLCVHTYTYAAEKRSLLQHQKSFFAILHLAVLSSDAKVPKFQDIQ